VRSAFTGRSDSHTVPCRTTRILIRLRPTKICQGPYTISSVLRTSNLRAERQKIRQQLEEGQVRGTPCTALCELADRISQQIFGEMHRALGAEAASLARWPGADTAVGLALFPSRPRQVSRSATQEPSRSRRKLIA